MTGRQDQSRSQRLADAVALDASRVIGTPEAARFPWSSERPALVILAAGRGTRFGAAPKCVQPVAGLPLARHTIQSFRHHFSGPVIAVIGYRHKDVAAALGSDLWFVRSDNPVGGTAFAVYEAFCLPELDMYDPPLFIAMGDRIVPHLFFERLWAEHRRGGREADLTFLTARYEPPRHQGKGRILRDAEGRVLRIIEERDLQAESNELTRQALASLTEGNCPLYLIRARRLKQCLSDRTADNAQGQYYLTDIVGVLASRGGDIRTVTTVPTDRVYDLLTADLTRPEDLPLLEALVQERRDLLAGEADDGIERAVQRLTQDRPPGQVAAIARQLAELLEGERREGLGFDPEAPVAIGVSGGRLRIAFMHPDMVRFYGPAWQMAIGAADADGREQVVMLVQAASDRRLHLVPMDPRYRESRSELPADGPEMYPDEEISDLHAYEAFGTRMSETLLLALGYFSDAELAARRARGLPLPPSSLWVSSNRRRPFALVANALASLRTLRSGHLGARVQAILGSGRFQGLRVIVTGGIPQGGFSSSSAVTLAVKNALNALYAFELPDDLLIWLASQAEYGTGVRAGSLDQATEQKGRPGQGALISSNPAEGYRLLGMFRVPTDRIALFFPYSVARDRDAWRWSWGGYAERPEGPRLTAEEFRKMTGKAAEIAAVLTRLPFDTSFFQWVEKDVLSTGRFSMENRRRIAALLRALPLRIRRQELRARLEAERDWVAEQWRLAGRSRDEAERLAAGMADALLDGWREPMMRRTLPSGEAVDEPGVPLRAMVAYLFGEVAKNACLLYDPEGWITYVTASQRGDRMVEVDWSRLPDRAALEGELPWERDVEGPARLDRWLERLEAGWFDFDRGLDDDSLSGEPPDFVRLEGSNFFRGLALVDLVEAMLKRAFGPEAVAVRINAAGQGDYFQVHVDRRRADPSEVKAFLVRAFYRRFGLNPQPPFVEPSPGGGAVGVRLSRYRDLELLLQRLDAWTKKTEMSPL
jgi:hypothetical protein